MNVLITGSTGFIGARLARLSLERGHAVTALGMTNTPAEESRLAALHKAGVEVKVGSITEPDTLQGALSGCNIVFHLAAAQHEANVPDEYFRNVNVNGTRNMLDAALAAGVDRFVHGSTIGVYGAALDGEIDEASTLSPDNIYGTTKLEGEQLVRSYADRLPVSIARISETYGPGDMRLLKLFKAIKKKMFFMIGKGANKHQLIYVDDLVDGLYRAAETPAAAGETFVLAGREVLTTDDMVAAVARSLDLKPPGLRSPLWPWVVAAVVMEKTLSPLGIQPPLHRRRLDFFRKSFFFSRAKTQQLLNFTPQVDFADGTRRTAAWYQEQGLL